MEEKRENPFGINKTKRYVSPGGEEEIYHEYKVNNHGSITLVDYMGGDATVERVATAGHGRQIFPDRPEHAVFMSYLFSHGIWEPFKSVQLKFSIIQPIASALHLVYAPEVNVNEYSGRYSKMLSSSAIPSLEQIAHALSEDPGKEERARMMQELFVQGRKQAYENYEHLLNLDMARELSRIGLGIDNDTRYFWKIDLLSLSQLVKRYQSLLHEDDTTLLYIKQIRSIASNVAPEAWRALIEEPLTTMKLTIPTDDQVVDPPLSPPGWKPALTRRAIAPDLEKILLEKKYFLDHGEFQVVDYMGEDSAPAQAARTSYGEGTKTLQDDKNLTRSLIRDLHTSPIEMAELAFETKAPVFIDPRQAGRHRTLDNHGFMGYTPVGDQFYFPPHEEFKYQDRANRQGRGKDMEDEDKAKAEIFLRETLQQEQVRAKTLRAMGAPEWLVRQTKGVGFYTKRWRTGDSHNLNHFLELRLDAHAQKEIRDLANLVNVAHAAHVPTVNEALRTYIINGLRFSEREISLLKKIFPSIPDFENLENYKGVGFLIPVDKEHTEKGYQLSREGQAFKEKLKKIFKRE